MTRETEQELASQRRYAFLSGGSFRVLLLVTTPGRIFKF